MAIVLKDSSDLNLSTQSLTQQSEQIGAGMQVGISSFGSWMLGVSTNIGSFAFLIHASMIAQSGPLASVVAWMLAALMTLPLALVLAELASMFPSAGGPYVYKYFALKRLVPGMGEMLGFLTGWIFWIYLVVGYACMSNGLVNLLSTSMWGSPQSSPLWFGPLIILALFGGTTVLNLMQVKSAARLNSFFTLLKLAVAFAFGILAFSAKTSSWSNLLTTGIPLASGNFVTNVALVLPLAIAGFSGIEIAACTASETTNAKKAVPRAIIMTVITVALVYIGMCIAVSIIAPYDLNPDKSLAIVPGTTIIATAPSLAAYLGGKLWGFIITTGVVLSILSCAFGGILSSARTSLSMAETGLFPVQFAQLDRTTLVPKYALLFQFLFMTSIGICANILSKTGIVPDAYTFLGGSCAFIYAILAMLYGVCLIGLRYTDPDMPRPFRLGKSGNQIAWSVALTSFLVFAFVALFCTNFTHQAAGLFFLLAGIPIYGFYRWRR